MGSLGNLFKNDSSAKVSKVVGIKKSGLIVVRVNNIDYSVKKATSESIRVGDTVLLNNSSNGKLFIVGKTTGLGSQNNIEEIYRNG